MAVALFAAYWFSPSLAQPLLAWLLQPYGVSQLRLQLDRPRWSGLRVESLSFMAEGHRVRIREGLLSYAPANLLAQRRLSAIQAGEVEVAVGDSETDIEVTLAALMEPMVWQAFWEALPADRIAVESFRVTGPVSEANGRLRIESAKASMNLAAGGLAFDLDIDQSGTFALQATGLAGANAAMSGQIDVAARLIEAQVTAASSIAATGQFAGLTGVNGLATLEMRLKLPWRKNLGDLVEAAVAAGSFRMSAAKAPEAFLELQGDFRLTDGRVEMTADRDGTRLRWRGTPWALAGRLSSDLTEQFLDWSLKARRDSPGLPFAVEAEGMTEWNADRLPATGRLNLGLAAIPFEASYDRAAESLHFTIDHQHELAAPLLATLFPKRALGADLMRGTLGVSASGGYEPQSGLHAVADVFIANGVAGIGPIKSSGISARTRMSYANGGLSFDEIVAQAALADLGFPISSLRAEASLQSLQPLLIKVKSLAGRTFGGAFSTSAFSYDAAQGDTELDLRIQGMRLGELLALQGDGFSGTGVLDGTLPLRIAAGSVLVAEGRVAARPPGGTIRYADAAGVAETMERTGLDFALNALGDFRYQSLEAGVDYGEDGVLALGIRLEGYNPEVESGRPIHYNLNVTQNLSALLQALQLSSRIDKRIEERAKGK